MSLCRRPIFVALLVLLFLSGSPEGRGRRASSSNAHILAVTLVGSVQMSPFARRGMLAEATRIWRQEGVGLIWNNQEADSRELRVVFVRAELRSPISERQFPIAEFHRQQRRIVASLGAANRAVAAGAARGGAWWLAQQHDCALGLVLGRSLAHEIGHYLLGTADHAHRGLMRASFPARELVDPRAANFFRLDDPGAELLTARLDAGLLRPTAATH